MSPIISTLLKTLAAIATAVTQPIRSAAMAVLEPISSLLRRMLVPPSFSDLEAAAGAAYAVKSHKKPVDWRKVVVTFCFGGGFGFLSVSVETRSEPSTSFLVMLVLISLAFSFVFVSDFILAKHPVAAGVLELMGVLSAAAALFTALCVPLTMTLKCVVWSIFASTVAGVFIINFTSSSSA